jgi:hypothetical protein
VIRQASAIFFQPALLREPGINFERDSSRQGIPTNAASNTVSQRVGCTSRPPSTMMWPARSSLQFSIFKITGAGVVAASDQHSNAKQHKLRMAGAERLSRHLCFLHRLGAQCLPLLNSKGHMPLTDISLAKEIPFRT